MVNIIVENILSALVGIKCNRANLCPFSLTLHFVFFGTPMFVRCGCGRSMLGCKNSFLTTLLLAKLRNAGYLCTDTVSF